jgi:hypothetical protein
MREYHALYCAPNLTATKPPARTNDYTDPDNIPFWGDIRTPPPRMKGFPLIKAIFTPPAIWEGHERRGAKRVRLFRK